MKFFVDETILFALATRLYFFTPIYLILYFLVRKSVCYFSIRKEHRPAEFVTRECILLSKIHSKLHRPSIFKNYRA